MNNRKITKSTKRRLMTVGLISFVIIIYFFVSLVTYGFSIIKLSNQERELKESLINLKDNEQDLKIEIQKLKDPEYIARYARENYLYSKDGEYIIKIDRKDKEEVSELIMESDNYLYLYILVGFGIVIYIYRHKKKKKKEN